MSTNTTVNNIPESPSASTCELKQTTDQQLQANLEEFAGLIVTLLQDGTIPVKNSDRLQNLGIDDIIELVKSSINIPNIYNHIVTNTNNDITNMISIINDYKIVKDSKFVQSDFIRFKVIQEDGITKLICHLPQDIINLDRIVQIYITTKADDVINPLKNVALFEYNIYQDPTDIFSRYQLEIPTTNLNFGTTEIFNVDNLPDFPENWGEYGKDHFIKVVYLVDDLWERNPPVEENLNTGEYHVSKIVSSAPMAMNYGLASNTNKETVNFIKETDKAIINEVNITPFQIPETSNLLKGIDFNKFIIDIITNNELNIKPEVNLISLCSFIINIKKKNFELIEEINFLSDTNFIIEQKETNVIKDELVNIFVVPSAKVISQENIQAIIVQELSNYLEYSTKVIELKKINTIEFDTTKKIPITNESLTRYDNYMLYLMTNMFNDLSFNFIPDYNFVIEKFDHVLRDLVKYEIFSHDKIKIINFENHIIQNLKTDTNYIKLYNYIIEQIMNNVSNIQVLFKNVSFFNHIIEVVKITIMSYVKQYNFDSSGIHIIEPKNTIINRQMEFVNRLENPIYIIELLINLVTNMNINYKIVKNLISIIEQDYFENIIYVNKTKFFQSGNNIIELKMNNDSEKITINKNVAFDKTARELIINQLAIVPCEMVIQMGTLSYISHLNNIRLATNLVTKTDFYPLYTGENIQQRDQYEFIADENQSVFNIKTTSNEITVYREGWRLSRGDYYTNGTNVILKSPANIGENVTIIIERKYSYSNTVTKDELDLKLELLKTDKPFIVYPISVYELGIINIQIKNYMVNATYNITVRFDNKFLNIEEYYRINDVIYINVPEVVGTNMKNIDVTISSIVPGKMQSLVAVASIKVKNLYDNLINDEDINRLLIVNNPTIYTEWDSKPNFRVSTFENVSTSNSVYTVLEQTETLPTRISIEQDKYIQSKILNNSNVGDISGNFIESYIGIENVSKYETFIFQSTLNQTYVIFKNYTQEQFIKAFEENKIYVILDTLDKNSTYKNSYRLLNEFTDIINLLPNGENIILEHTKNLKNRLIKKLILIDLEFKIDYDFNNLANISETNDSITIDIEFDSISMLEDNNHAYLNIISKDPKVKSISNKYLQVGSELKIPITDSDLNSKQILNNKSLFSVYNLGLRREFDVSKESLLDLDQPSLYNMVPRFKKFYFGSNSGYYTNNIQSTFIIGEEDDYLPDIYGIKDGYIGLISCYNTLVDGNPISESKIKIFDQYRIKKKSFKSIIEKTKSIDLSNRNYSSDAVLIQFGGSVKIISEDTNFVNSDITYREIFIKGNKNIENGINPATDTSSDGFHMKYGNEINIKIPTIWDCVIDNSLIEIKEEELNYIWDLLKTNIDINDARWNTITHGILEKGNNLLKDNSDLELSKNSEVINIENSPNTGFFIFGGNAYKATKNRIVDSAIINDDNLLYFTLNDNYDINKLQLINDIRKATDGTELLWQNKVARINTRTGWENGEPYIDFSWVITIDNEDTNIVYYFVDRVSREKIPNKDIYYINTTDILNNPDFALEPSLKTHENNIINKIDLHSYSEIFNNINGERILDIQDHNLPIFSDVIYNKNNIWLTIRKNMDTILYKLYTNTDGGYLWEKVTDLDLDDPNPYKWTMAKDPTTSLTGSGPLLIKHTSINNVNNNSNLDYSGIYHYNTQLGKIELKSDILIPETSNVLSIFGIYGFSDPCLIGIDTTYSKNYKINLIGNFINIMIDIENYLSLLSSDEIDTFKTDIRNINLLDSKAFKLLPNTKTLKIKNIIPENDNYLLNSAQIIFERVNINNISKAENLVFRLTNKSINNLEVDNIRFIMK